MTNYLRPKFNSASLVVSRADAVCRKNTSVWAWGGIVDLREHVDGEIDVVWRSVYWDLVLYVNGDIDAAYWR